MATIDSAGLMGNLIRKCDVYAFSACMLTAAGLNASERTRRHGD
jgi:hypothetical protein